MSNSVEKPMHLRARMDRGGGQIIGAVTLLGGLGFIMQGGIGDVFGGLLLVYAGLIAMPLTRMFASRRRLGFTKWRAYGARLIWFGLLVIGLIAAYPY